MSTTEFTSTRTRTGADRLLSQMRKDGVKVLMRPYCLGGRWHAFVWAVTNKYQQVLPTRIMAPLIRDGVVRVASVSPDGNLLYEAVE